MVDSHLICWSLSALSACSLFVGEDLLESAFVEGAVEEDFGDRVGVVLVLRQERLVDLELDEAEVVESSHTGGELLVRLFADLLEVDFLRGHLGSEDAGDGKLVLLMEVWKLTFLVGQDFEGLFVVGVEDYLWLGLLDDLFDLFLKLGIEVFIQFRVINFDLLCNKRHRLGGFLDDDAAPDLVAETDVVAEGQPEVLNVLSFFLRGLHLNSPLVLSLRSDRSFESNGVCSQGVTVGWNENDILRPGSYTVVTHGPGLGEDCTWSHFK